MEQSPSTQAGNREEIGTKSLPLRGSKHFGLILCTLGLVRSKQHSKAYCFMEKLVEFYHLEGQF